MNHPVCFSTIPPAGLKKWPSSLPYQLQIHFYTGSPGTQAKANPALHLRSHARMHERVWFHRLKKQFLIIFGGTINHASATFTPPSRTLLWLAVISIAYYVRFKWTFRRRRRQKSEILSGAKWVPSKAKSINFSFLVLRLWTIACT